MCNWKLGNGPPPGVYKKDPPSGPFSLCTFIDDLDEALLRHKEDRGTRFWSSINVHQNSWKIKMSHFFGFQTLSQMCSFQTADSGASAGWNDPYAPRNVLGVENTHQTC